MKKLLILTLVVTILTLTVSATDGSVADVPSPTTDEVEELILDAYDIFMNIYGWYKSDESIDVLLNDGYNSNYTAATRKDSPYYSYWIEKSKSIYTDDIAEDMLFLLNTAVKFNDKFYVIVDAGMDPGFSVLEGSGALSSGDVDIPGFDGDLRITFDEKVGNEIVAHFSYRQIYFHIDEEPDLRTSVNLKYENGKWQISGGEYIDLMIEHRRQEIKGISVISAPQTSLTAVAYVTVAIAALGVVVAKKRK